MPGVKRTAEGSAVSSFSGVLTSAPKLARLQLINQGEDMARKTRTRKKYRKGQTYMYLVSGIKSTPNLGYNASCTFMNSGTLTLLRDMDACEMRDEVMFHVKKFNELSDEPGTYAIYSYHVETN
jgi:hypothetical protein